MLVCCCSIDVDVGLLLLVNVGLLLLVDVDVGLLLLVECWFVAAC